MQKSYPAKATTGGTQEGDSETTSFRNPAYEAEDAGEQQDGSEYKYGTEEPFLRPFVETDVAKYRPVRERCDGEHKPEW